MGVSRFLLLAMLVSPALAQDPGPGIARELASARAGYISDVRYQLDFDLVENSDTVRGEAIVSFTLPDGSLPVQPVVLDFDGHELEEVLVNGVPQKVRLVHNHIVVTTENLDPGRNQFRARFASRVAPTGTPLSVFRDKVRGEEFLYTLVVPADAHRLFPCFDQPDIKAIVDLRLTVPPNWVAIANSAAKDGEPHIQPDGRKRYEFEDTPRLSTYLVAFAAGPFSEVIGPVAGGNKMRLFVRRSALNGLEASSLFSMHQRSVRWLERYFDQPYPFGKLDIVLVPGFPYGGMEHAGAIFYRESALFFDHAPTQSELVRRSTLIYHEVSHQWFGNLVTMRWFDDLWLKEGFATFVGYQLLDALEPERNAWLRFQQRVKPTAYRVDATHGTTPVYQELPNLADAKSAYGPIVYNKAPAVLRELHERLGPKEFRNGVRLFLSRHAYQNATWSDLVDALQRASGRDLGRWSERWILTAGMPRVSVDWSSNADGEIDRFEILQEAVQGGAGAWPLRVEMLWVEASGETRMVEIETDQARTALTDVVGQREPACVLLNPRDVAYGQFVLDPKSQQYCLRQLASETDPLRRAVALGSLFDSVREAELAPARLAELLIDLLAAERDPLTQASLLGPLSTILRRYLHEADRRRLTTAVVTTLMAGLHEGREGLELQTFRFLARQSAADSVLALCRELLAERSPVPGLELGQQDRYLALAALIAAGQAGKWRDAMTGAKTPSGAAKYAFTAQAAGADAGTKQRYFETYLQPGEPPEQWMQASLANFHWQGQGELTLPYLRKALDQVHWVKANRKIFFMPAWINAFVNGHSDPEALRIVEEFLTDHPDLAPDIRLKILQSVDGLRRAVAIIARWQ